MKKVWVKNRRCKDINSSIPNTFPVPAHIYLQNILLDMSFEKIYTASLGDRIFLHFVVENVSFWYMLQIYKYKM